MCMNDWRAGQLITNNVQLFSIGNATGLTMAANPSRVALVIAPRTIISGTNGFLVTFSGGAAFTVAYATGYLNLSLPVHGRLVQQGFVISLLVGNIDGTILESLMPMDYLAAGLEQFKSEYRPRL